MEFLSTSNEQIYNKQNCEAPDRNPRNLFLETDTDTSNSQFFFL